MKAFAQEVNRVNMLNSFSIFLQLVCGLRFLAQQMENLV